MSLRFLTRAWSHPCPAKTEFLSAWPRVSTRAVFDRRNRPAIRSRGVPVHLFNFHGYRTWMPDHARGYTRHGEGVLPPDADMAGNYHRRAKFNRVLFDERRQGVVVHAALEVGRTIGIDVHYAVCVSTHAHVVVGWRDGRSWEQLYDRMKRIIGFKLAKAEGVPGRRWLAARRAGKRVQDARHLRHLMTVYLPGHRGVTWVDRVVLARVDTRGHTG